jgi:hypothetical protein
VTFGPWAPGLDAAERRARCRAMRALVLTLVRDRSLIALLAAAETDDAALGRALEALDALPALPRRRLLATYAALSEPRR